MECRNGACQCRSGWAACPDGSCQFGCCTDANCPSGSFCRRTYGCFKEIGTCPAGTDWCARTPAATYGDACNRNRACTCHTTTAGGTECTKSLAGSVGDGCSSDAACEALIGLGGVCIKDTGPGCGTTNGSFCGRRCDACPYGEKECAGRCVPEGDCCDALCPGGKVCQNGQCACDTNQRCGGDCPCPTGKTCVGGTCCPATRACGSVCCPTTAPDCVDPDNGVCDSIDICTGKLC